MSGYRELAPSRDLYSLVACRWVRDVPHDDPSDSTLILPDGCVDLIWRDGALTVAGLDRTARLSPVAPGQRYLGVRLRPGVAGAVLGIPASELLGEQIELDEVLGGKAVELAAKLGEGGEVEQILAGLEQVVSSQVEDGGPDPLVQAATRRLGFPGSRVDRLADSLGISDRQLRRRFHRAVGYGPKMLDRVLRFRRLVSAAPEVVTGQDDLARIAADLGYADQAHMTRDCVELSHLTPAELASIWAT
jgi:AraC-like DNA-binding protein